MNPLETNRQVLTWLCGVPPHKSDSKRKKIAYAVFTSSLILLAILAVLAGAIFIYRNVSVNLEESFVSLFFTIGALQVLYQSIVTILQRRKLLMIFERLSTIYNENKNDESIHLLEQTNNTCQWIWPIYFKCVFGSTFLMWTLTAVCSVAYCYFVNGHIDGDLLYRPFKLTLPWNQSTSLGYSLEISLDIICAEAYLLSNGSLLILFISMCLHHQTFYQIFRNKIEKLNNRDEDQNVAEHLCNIIRFHISTNDWFTETATVYSPFILIVLISNMLILACTVFQFDLQMKHLDWRIVTIVIVMIVVAFNLFVYCYYGKMATESYEKMADCVYDFNWHELDQKYQKYLIIIMGNAQRPIYYHGFGIAVLNLETFLRVVRAVYTYYMIFKTLTYD